MRIFELIDCKADSMKLCIYRGRASFACIVHSVDWICLSISIIIYICMYEYIYIYSFHISHNHENKKNISRRKGANDDIDTIHDENRMKHFLFAVYTVMKHIDIQSARIILYFIIYQLQRICQHNGQTADGKLYLCLYIS